jgi:hypothetical protein
MKALLVYPKYPDTFWSFKYALSFISKRAVHPPLGLLTVAAMLPGEWEKRLVDMNVARLKDQDLQWADYVFISAMAVQKKSVGELISRCKESGVKIVAGVRFLLRPAKISRKWIIWCSMKPRLHSRLF